MRALHSVNKQTLCPDAIVLVDNSDDKSILRRNKQNFHDIFPEGIYLKTMAIRVLRVHGTVV